MNRPTSSSGPHSASRPSIMSVVGRCQLARLTAIARASLTTWMRSLASLVTSR